MNVGMGLLKFSWALVKAVLLFLDAALPNKKIPVCGAFEAYSRRERDEISHEDFLDAIDERRHR